MADQIRCLYDPSATRRPVLAHRSADDPAGGGGVTAPRATLPAMLAASLAGVALLTLLPAGAGWTWGSPVAELHWYAGALESGTAMLQLVGNLGLLTPAAVLAVLLWPALGSPLRLAAAALASGTAVELLQWVLPLGRVVSPLDALLNAAGAFAVGLVFSRVLGARSAALDGRQ